MAFFTPSLRRAAPKLSRDFFVCHKCLQKQSRSLGSVARFSIPRSAAKSSPILRNVQQVRSKSAAAGLPAAGGAESPLGVLSRTIGQTAAQSESRSSFPKVSSKAVAYWLLGSAASVFGIVVFGGLTRLTESGLSITEWKPVTGALPPMSEEDWNSEFEKYRASPEFKLLNPYMELPEFKKIYYMEWGHRLWGRFVGLSFVIPAVYFVARRRVSANMSFRLLGIAGLIGFQGFLGWWMVKSGLKDDLFAPGSHPRVSQYRLTAHLGAAFLCYTAMLWNGLTILRENRLLANAARGQEHLLKLSSPALSIFRKSVAGLALLVFVTAMSGGLVAGLDAGLIYNEFPFMGAGLAPPKSELWDKFYSRKEDGSDLWWRNMLENPSTVQLDHRMLAMTTFTAILALWSYTRFSPRVAAAMTKDAKKGMTGVVHLVLMQAALGISTLIYLVPTPLAAAHQAGSLALLTGVLVLGNRIWVPKRTLRLVQNSLKRFNAAGKGNVVPGSAASGHPEIRAVKADLEALKRNGPVL